MGILTSHQRRRRQSARASAEPLRTVMVEGRPVPAMDTETCLVCGTVNLRAAMRYVNWPHDGELPPPRYACAGHSAAEIVALDTEPSA